MKPSHPRGWLRSLALLIVVTSLLAGCAEPGRILLDQPFAPPSQKHLALEPAEAWYDAQGGRQACLLTFNLPQARSGPRAFVIYFSGPDRRGEVAVSASERDTVRGFLVQEIGQLAGRAGFAGGSIASADVWMVANQRDLRLDVRCDDGTHITGTARIQASPPDVHTFERQYAADVVLVAPEAVATSGTPTGVREPSRD